MVDPIVYPLLGMATALIAAFLGLWLVGGFAPREKPRRTPPAE